MVETEGKRAEVAGRLLPGLRGAAGRDSGRSYGSANGSTREMPKRQGGQVSAPSALPLPRSGVSRGCPRALGGEDPPGRTRLGQAGRPRAVLLLLDAGGAGSARTRARGAGSREQGSRGHREQGAAGTQGTLGRNMRHDPPCPAVNTSDVHWALCKTTS